MGGKGVWGGAKSEVSKREDKEKKRRKSRSHVAAWMVDMCYSILCCCTSCACTVLIHWYMMTLEYFSRRLCLESGTVKDYHPPPLINKLFSVHC